MKSLARGQKIKLADLTSSRQLRVQLSAQAAGLTFDFSCFGVDEAGKLSDDRYFVFYNQPNSPENALQMLFNGDFTLDLGRLSTKIKRLVFVATIDGQGSMANLRRGAWSLQANGSEQVRFDFRGDDFQNEKSLLVAEIYLKDVWRVAAIGQGFAGGLEAVLNHFGGQAIDSAPNSPVVAPAPTALQAPPARPASSSTKCCDCGKTLNLIERGVNTLSGDNRCSACDRAFEAQKQLRAQQQVQGQLALRQQVIERILGGDLPVVAPVDAGIVLKKNEVCHYATPAALYEERVTSTVRVGQTASARVRICKGVTYRVGATRGRSISVTGLVQIDAGRLIVTNKRCVFDGQKKSFSVPFTKLISFEPFANGLELNAENKKTQHYQIGDGELAAAILSTALNS